MLVFYFIKCAKCWHCIYTRNRLTHFCCWRIFWVICIPIYFFHLSFNVSINMYDMLCDFIYWLNSYMLFFSDGITLSKKSLFLHSFSWKLSLFSVLKQWKQFKEHYIWGLSDSNEYLSVRCIWLYVNSIQSNAPYRQVLTTQLNHLASLAKWLSVCLRTKWFGFESRCCHLNLRYGTCFK